KKRGLEVGVGTGRFAQNLGISTGIDPSEKMLEIARARGVDAKVGFGENIPFPDGTFDYVAIIITLCFVKDPAKVLAQARRVLKSAGRIIVAIVDKESFLGRYYQRKKSVFYKQARFLSVKEAIGLLKGAGFSRFVFYQTISVLPKKMASVEKPKKGFGKGGFIVIGARKGILRGEKII
ncbi:MAG: class I SAM-dependent methyltransferase, partial [Candidatus Omnitrophica bacterium]|nr:class I SAM-dependent methyltransferase [Candidatus Omnitrophota bacterium]